MKANLSPTDTAQRRKDERGAALVTTLLLSTLLLMAGGALVMTTSMTAATVIDSTAEAQAYYGAEAGLQATLSALRGNIAPDSSRAGKKMNLRNALNKDISNKPGNTPLPIMSAWLQYDNTYPDRVPLSPNYTPMNGIAYSVVVSDPDNTPPSGTPTRLLIRSTGYGPHSAIKQLELIVKEAAFDFEAPGMLTVRGADDGSQMNFTLGSDPKKNYSGADNANQTATALPTFVVTAADSGRAASQVAGGGVIAPPPIGVMPIDPALNPGASGANAAPAIPVNPSPPTVPKVPSFLQTADQARALVSTLRSSAQDNGRYFTSYNGSSGSTSAPAFTFVDGNATITGGAGLVVVTGNCLLHENYGFSGLILVLGNGTLSREGGGPSQFYGSLVVARFGATGGFLAPTYSTQPDQGNVVSMQYDSAAVQSALALTGLRVMGVVER